MPPTKRAHAAAAPAKATKRSKPRPAPVTVHVIGPGGNVTEAVELTPGVPVRLTYPTVLVPGPDDPPPAEPEPAADPEPAEPEGGGG